ncbi:pancreatic lipase-related protein 2 [Orussus abietinus]|uniref:pancreatic lipase-related protein 2 n=1 Tax=Orussus abietinus TaxID=222816 RepID=UPI0006258311|nr:pancreatic lipase-related protein 2 [Orussus abietinus]
MIGIGWLLLIVVLLSLGSFSVPESRFPNARLAERRDRVARRRAHVREELRSKICFDLVGCFDDPAPQLTLRRPPEHPNVINTKFLLYTRENREEPQVLEYNDEFRSILESRFNVSKRLKVIVHGYKGSGTDEGAIFGLLALLDKEDLNVIVIDWARGAGTTYGAAVANTELVGRQLALVLLKAISLGMDPADVHVVGFSLGAHVAGCASEILKARKILIGRITGLDPASPFFKHHLLRERSRKLDVSDARFVDVIHTDGSEVFTDGFGLLGPIGHVDFFPNGGRQQPGCTDVRNSVVASHLNAEFLDKGVACSHLRAWKYFVESVQPRPDQECRFVSWPCKGGAYDFVRGMCFPRFEPGTANPVMGYDADQGPLGVLYLPTRSRSPFCGDPLRATAITFPVRRDTLGILVFRIFHGNDSTTFQMRSEKRGVGRSTFHGIAAAEFQAITEKSTLLNGMIWYKADVTTNERPTVKRNHSDMVLPLHKLFVEDRRGIKWEYQGLKTATISSEQTEIQLLKQVTEL